MPLSCTVWVEWLAWCSMVMGVASCTYIALDQRHRPEPHMAVMKYVWPLNALWAGVLGIWAYRALGNGRLHKTAPAAMPMDRNMPMDMPVNMPMDMPMDMPMSGMSMPQRPFWQSIAAGTLHCGAGCTLADMAGPWLFRLVPFTVLGNAVWGEWTLEYGLALLTGVVFQYAGLAAMTSQRGPALWWRAFRVDVLSLSAWQVGMYGWMGLVIFAWLGPLDPTQPLFWFMMQIAMACGFVTAYPMNWWLVRAGIKSAM